MSHTDHLPALKATPAQQTELIRLLNHPTITRAEKTKTILSVNGMSTADADAKINELRREIPIRQAAYDAQMEVLRAEYAASVAA